MFYNIDCIEGAQKYLQDGSVDLIITDPPYGIDGDKLHKHYNRNEKNVLDGYVDIPINEYEEFSFKWIKEAERVLRPGGSIYIVSGYTNLIHILNALKATCLKEINHIIWKYNFGVYTKNKYISSHYHILYYVKPGGKPTFNTFARYGDSDKDENNRSLNYQDREDVWLINREFKPNQIKNKNELPRELLIKMIQYSSNPGDLVCDFFLGSFSTAKVSIGLNRNATGFEISKIAFEHQIKKMDKIQKGFLIPTLRKPSQTKFINSGKPLTEIEKENFKTEFLELISNGKTKKQSIEYLSEKYSRGYWSILKIIDGTTNKSSISNSNKLNDFSNETLFNTFK
ncbi:MAG: DNA-methyltransferase [Candidatus Kapaibacteriota bacterium]